MFGFKIDKVFLSMIAAAIGWETYAYNDAMSKIHVSQFMTDEDVLALIEYTLNHSEEFKRTWEASDDNQKINIVNSLLDQYNNYCHNKL